MSTSPAIHLIIATKGNAALEAEAVKLMLERHVAGIICATMYPRIVKPPPAIYQLPTMLLDNDCGTRYRRSRSLDGPLTSAAIYQ